MTSQKGITVNPNDKEAIKKLNEKFSKMSREGADEMAKQFGMKPKKKTAKKK